MQSKIEQGRQNNTSAIANEINKLAEVNYGAVSRLLPELLKEGALVLDHSVYLPQEPWSNPFGAGRYLVYDHDDEQSPFSIWAFAFGAGQKTCIHDHKYQGAVTVLHGPVAEKYYIPSGENTAQLVARSNRYSFHSNRDDLTNNFVHQLKRRKKLDNDSKLDEGISVTLHIYDMPAFAIDLSGSRVDSRNLDRIYERDRSFGKSNIPYTEEYPDTEKCALKFSRS